MTTKVVGPAPAFSSNRGSLLSIITYNKLLKPKDLTLGNGAQTTLSYYGNNDLDANGVPYGSLKSISTTKAGLPAIQSLEHTYDEVGNLTR